MTDIILESISDGVFTVDAEWRVTSFNRAAERIMGIDRKDAIGKTCHEVFKSSLCDNECPLRQTIRTGEAISDMKGYFIDFGGKRVPVSLSTASLTDGAGRPMGGAETFRDLREIEELKQKLRSRDGEAADADHEKVDIRSRKAEAERLLITETLERMGHKCALVAQELKIDKATLYRKMKAYGIPLPRKRAKS